MALQKVNKLPASNSRNKNKNNMFFVVGGGFSLQTLTK